MNTEKEVFVEIERKGQKHARSLRKHPTHEEIANTCSDLKQIEDIPMKVSRRGRPRSQQDSANSTLPGAHEVPLDRIDFNAPEIISVLSNSPSESIIFVPPRMTPAIIQTRSGVNAKKQSQSNKDESPIRRSKRIM